MIELNYPFTLPNQEKHFSVISTIVFFHVLVNPGFTPVMVFFEQDVVDGIEGNTAVVCATVVFPRGPLERQTEAQVIVDVSVLDQGSAGIKIFMN